MTWKWTPVPIAFAAAAYLAWAELSTDPTEADRLASALALKPGMTVAEIGAGNGKMAEEMSRRVGRGGAGPGGRVQPGHDVARVQGGSAGVPELPANNHRHGRPQPELRVPIRR